MSYIVYSLREKLEAIYNSMLKEYGSQGWWPVTPVGSCRGSSPKPIYGAALNGERQKYEVIFGAILTQNTSWKNVEKAIICLNEKGLMSPDEIIKSDHSKLAECIRSSGYYNQKAERLKIISSFLKKNPLKKLENMGIEELRSLLLNLKGIGQETADSIMLYALEKPVFVIDAYTKRIMSRIGLCRKEIKNAKGINKEVKYEYLQDLFMKNLSKDAKLFNEYHALFVEHAKRHCMVKPVCKDCILGKKCKRIL